MQECDFYSVEEFARIYGRSRSQIVRMVHNGILTDTGHKVLPIPSKRGGRKIGRYAIGVPKEVAEQLVKCQCPDCGKQWEQDGSIPIECPSCGSTSIERRAA